MELDTAISNAISKFVDCKYAIDEPSSGYDCLNTLMSFYKELGVEMPAEFEGWTMETYGKLAREGFEKAHAVFERFIQTLGKEINKHFMQRGDLILCRVQDKGIYAGIYLGNGNAFFMFWVGGRVCPIAPFKDYIVSVRRLI